MAVIRYSLKPSQEEIKRAREKVGVALTKLDKIRSRKKRLKALIYLQMMLNLLEGFEK